ncbi:MAG: dipeptide ABC transporter ATP-binding protein [Gammaproteobacteria bacterium]
MDKPAPLLEVQALSKRFTVRGGFFSRATGWVRAVDDVSFTIAAGETLGLVGESGCGKSTVGKTILKLIAPDAGAIKLDGQDITAFDRRRMVAVRRQMQIIFQDPYAAINPRMSAGDFVGEPLAIHALAGGKKRESRVAELFRKVGLRAEQMRRYPHEFSGGQRQRIAIARALSLNPRLIVADEAVSALDVSIRAAIINLLMDLQQEFGLSYLFISHDIGVVEHISHRVAVMYLGRIVELASRASLFASPRHPYTEALLAAAPIPNPRLRQSHRVLLQGEPPSPIHPPAGCRFHTRCPLAVARCTVETPALRQLAADHAVACHLR